MVFHKDHTHRIQILLFWDIMQNAFLYSSKLLIVKQGEKKHKLYFTN